MKRLPYLLTAALCLVAAVPAVSANPGGGPSPACAAPSASFRPDLPGAYKVGHITDTATDQSRSRLLRYDVWYPVNPAQPAGSDTVYELDEYFYLGHSVPRPSTLADEGVAVSSAGPFPLIVYSHSGGGTRWEAFDLCELLASHGYVVISADHVGGAWIGDAVWTGDESDPLRHVQVRGPDCSFLVDTAQARNSRPGDLLRGRINPHRVGGFGWSYGGLSISAMGGGYADYRGDRRLDAMVLFSPTTSLQTPAELERINVPAILFSGTQDGSLPSVADTYARVSGPHMLVNMEGADHGSFSSNHLFWDFMAATDQPDDVLAVLSSWGGRPSDEWMAAHYEYRRIVSLYTVAGFDRYLKNSSRAEAWLTKSYAQAHEPNIAQLRIGVSPDLNGNDVVDRLDIARGTSRDANRNHIPDEVDGPILRVCAGATGHGTGQSWANAVTDLRRALELARASRNRVQEIWVAAGVYAPDVAPASVSSFFQVRNVALYGGFAGHETARCQRDAAAHVTVLTGDLLGDDLPGFGNKSDNTASVLRTLRSSAPLVVDGFTVQGGWGDFGGGIVLRDGLIQNCIIRDNAATYGGGIGGSYTLGTIKDCLFTNNAGLYGGALELDNSFVTVTGCRFEDNFALGDSSQGQGFGGAVLAYTLDGGRLTLQNCTLRNNHSNAGGAIAVPGWGGAVSFTASNCLLHGNAALDLDASAGAGGALYLGEGQTAHLVNVTSVDNTSTTAPWSIAGGLTVHNSIIRDGTTWLDGTATINYSNVAGAFAGTGNSSSDPLFVNVAAGDFRLSRRSPCINAGLNSLLPADLFDLDGDGNVSELLPRDLAGQSRVSGPRVDMGAYEWRP